MRDADSYEEQSVNCLRAVMEDSADKAELYAQLDAMATDDVHALMEHADVLRMHARREWLHRTTRPAWL
jgi:hypothetical protein